jgi:chorismate mutase/prephenate dehydratase
VAGEQAAGGGLEGIRERLDAVDTRIVEALGERERLIGEVARFKQGGGTVVRDRGREEDLLTRLVDRAAAAGADRHLVTRVFREVLDHSLRLQHEHLVDRAGAAGTIVVAYQGTEGSYSHMAARRHFAAYAGEAVLRGFDTFPDILEAVKDGAATYALLPIENTTAGSINEAYDLLARMDLALVGEEVQTVCHCLLALEDVPLSRIRRVYSQIQALEQCTRFLATLADCHVESFTDTAMSCKLIRDQQDLSHAAIASEEAAGLYGLTILKRDIANQKDNFTRFVVAAREPLHFDPRIPCKTSLVLATRHERGALLACLNVLASQGLNLTKLESRPRPKVPWEYIFYVDFEGNVADPHTGEALRALAAHTSYLKVLGSYPARTTEDARHAEPRSPLAAAAAPSSPDRSAEATPSPGQPTEDPELVAALEKKPYKLASRVRRREDSPIRIGQVVLGGDRPVVIAGPCSVESREQIFACAKAVKEAGGDILRGGCFKPRTSPYSFQGMGYEGLDLLEEAGRAYGLPIVTEVLHPSDVERVAQQADALQIGARNMQNFALLKEAGRVDRPVMLKRGMMASIDEWLAAAEYILAAGNQQVFLCERGIRTFETATRNTLDLSAVVVARERSHLPVIVDPSHACGVRRWVPPMAEAALAVGAHGVMVETHPNPDAARSDGPQALTFDMLRDLMRRLAGARAQ